MCTRMKANGHQSSCQGDLIDPNIYEMFMPRMQYSPQPRVPRCSPQNNMDFSKVDCYHHMTFSDNQQKQLFAQKMTALRNQRSATGRELTFDFLLMKSGEVRFFLEDEDGGNNRRGH